MDLELTEETQTDGTVLLTLNGALDLVSRESALQAGNRVLSGGHGLVLDLSAVNFMDSTGIGVLIELSREAEDAGASFAIRNPSDRVSRVLALTGLEGMWAETATPDSTR